jgi:hypothetical protein
MLRYRTEMMNAGIPMPVPSSGFGPPYFSLYSTVYASFQLNQNYVFLFQENGELQNIMNLLYFAYRQSTFNLGC